MTSQVLQRVVDEKFYFIYTLATEICLPELAVLTLFDKNHPAESFGTLTALEWEDIVKGTELQGKGLEIFNRIAAWKLEANVYPGQSCIPPLDPGMYVLQIIHDDADDLPHTANAESTVKDLDDTGDTVEMPQEPCIAMHDGSETGLCDYQGQDVSDCSEPDSNNSCATTSKVRQMVEPSIAAITSGILPQKSVVPATANTLIFTPDDLGSLLANSEVGQFILRSSLKGPLSKDSKKELASIIASHHISGYSNNIGLCRLPKAVLENYVNCIKLRFPSENNDMITYYIPAAPPERKNPGGSIYQAYKRIKGTKRDRERKEHQHEATLSANENRNHCRAEHSEASRWLVLNNTPWETVTKMWQMSEASRFDHMKTLKPAEIIMKYRHYAEPLGYQLFDADYHSLGFAEVHDQFSAGVLEYMNQDNATEDALVCCTLILLNCCVRPCKINKNVRPTILTAQEDILLFTDNVESGVESIRVLFESYVAQNVTPHPKVIAIGSSYRNLTGEFYVIFDRIQYKTNSAARAVDIIIKMCNVMKQPFSKVSKLVWYTLEEVLYNIRAPAQYKDVETIKKLIK
ncbi:uncharacterized protein LOC131683496 isoform X3 [Topomyia yanbarensis]|uniref:uncharacterized protein LOC131683496 isoform X3 n=1 Tax=Topomyia yanbarensis TaxID=2498891 RepID=UPI00273A7762|nr:uncharacterized protein LOC131683496 isoform X3 [Topomyia yanbarensis]